MNKYLEFTKRIAEQTPPTRNRVVDFVRAVSILIVVFGHWLAASIWLRADGDIQLMNSLEWIPYAGWVTWIVQVMPIFFLVGGYANARALQAKEPDGVDYSDWVTQRVRRLFTPVIPLLLVWTVLIVVLGPFLPRDVVRAGAMSATVPVWFIAVYVSITALAPLTYRWWCSQGLRSFVVLCAAAVAVDVLRFAIEVPGVGWANFLFVWAAVHQLGYWWASRETSGRPITKATGLQIAGLSLTLLIVLTSVGWYPVAMVGVPGAEVTNMTPPTFAIALLAFAQAGVIWAATEPISRFAHRRRVWHGVVAVSGVMMTIYLWHLTAMTLVASVFLFAFDGAVFRIEPGTTAWWLSRPVWIMMLVLVTLALVAVFARFEWRVKTTPAPSNTRYVIAGVLLVAGASAAVAYFGLAAADATVNWIIPIAAFAGAAIMGAYPSRRRDRSASKPDSRSPDEDSQATVDGQQQPPR
jgi:fucose 4-O-acetylase-like acetyltransferase